MCEQHRLWWAYVDEQAPLSLQTTGTLSYYYFCWTSSQYDCIQLGPRSGITRCRAWSGSKLFFHSEGFVLKHNLLKIQKTKSLQNNPTCKQLILSIIVVDVTTVPKYGITPKTTNSLIMILNMILGPSYNGIVSTPTLLSN